MEFTISKSALQKELGFVQGTVEKKNTIPALSNILIESVGENTIRILGTDLDVTLRCETEADRRDHPRAGDCDAIHHRPALGSAPAKTPSSDANAAGRSRASADPARPA